MTIKDSLISRLTNLSKLNQSKELQAIALHLCKNDVRFFVREFCITFDPRVQPSLIPFIPYSFQNEYLIWRRERYKNEEQGVVLKCRDSGATFLNVVDQLHHWLFDDNFKGLFITRKEDLLDKIANPDSIFEKLRMILRNLPKWMLPKGFHWSKNSTFCKLVNPTNGSSITGEAGKESGRGGRSSICDVDETAFIEQAERVESAISNNANTIVYTSTPNGIGGLYYNKVMNPNIPTFRMEFWDDPRKNYWQEIDPTGIVVKEGRGKNKKAILTEDIPRDPTKNIILYPWLEKQKKVLDEIVIQQEILLRFDADIDGLFIKGTIVTPSVGLELPVTGEPNVQYPKHQTNFTNVPRVKHAALDVATTGKNLSILTIRQGSSVTLIKNMGSHDPTQLAYRVLDFYNELPENDRFQYLIIDADGIGAGTLSTLDAIENLPFELIAFRGGAKASDTYWEGEKKYSYEKFANRRAEAWGLIKWRLKNSYDHINGIKECDPDEMISIPDMPELISQISAPKYKYNSSRAIVLESKEDMLRRGVSSPDYADSLAYCFAPIEVDTDWLKDF